MAQRRKSPSHLVFLLGLLQFLSHHLGTSHSTAHPCTPPAFFCSYLGDCLMFVHEELPFFLIAKLNFFV